MKHNLFILLSVLVEAMIATPILMLFLVVGLQMGYGFRGLSIVGMLWYATTSVLVGWWCRAISKASCGVTKNHRNKSRLNIGDLIESGDGTVYRVNGVFGDYITYEAVSGIEEVADPPNRSDPPTLYYRGASSEK